jgi:hypothetical protein
MSSDIVCHGIVKGRNLTTWTENRDEYLGLSKLLFDPGSPPLEESEFMGQGSICCDGVAGDMMTEMPGHRRFLEI